MTGTARAPVLDVQSFLREEAEAPPPARPAPAAWSPFLSVYESANGAHEADEPVREAYATLVNDLYDEEFEESLFELLTSARGLHQDHLASGHSLADADRMVTQHFSQLMRESETMLDTMAREFGSRDPVAIDREMDMFAESYAPAAPLEPEFQDFLGKLAKKIGKGVRAVAKTAIKGITALGLGQILARVKPVAKWVLNQVLQKAIGRLPASVQPVARTLAQRLGLAAKPAAPAQPVAAAPSAIDSSGVAALPDTAAAPGAAPTGTTPTEPAPEDAGSPVQPSAGAEVPDMQLEFDELFAEAMLSEDEGDFELGIARAGAASNGAAMPVFTELDQARERLTHELANLKEGENPAPYVENFLPAVLPALRIATRLIGRPRIVGFLAGILGKLISNLVGPAQAPALSRAMVDAGLKLVNLELTDQEDPRIGTAAVAATIEETLTRVASLPDHVLDNQELLEGFAVEAFEQAAAANLPALFSDATYKKRPELMEGGVNATWVMLPMRRPRYKRCSRTFTVKITPHMAEAIESFESTPLSDYLQDQLGLPEGEDVEAEIHLFEVIPGGTAADIARHETETPGLGAADEVTLSQLHPLTDEAASVLLGKPGLGRRLRLGSSIRTVAPGQRLFHMVVGRRPVTILGQAGRRRVRRLVRVDVILDVPRDQVRVGVFLSEVKAHRLAVRLRQQTHVGSLAVAFQKLLGRRLPHILHGRRPRRLRIVHAAVAPGAPTGAALAGLPAIVPQIFITKLQEWLTGAFSEFAKTQAQKFLAASEDPVDGVTLMFTIDHPPGLKEMGHLLGQKGAAANGAAESIAKGAPPTVRVDALPGHKRD
jgi:hypothetical protein